MSGRYKIFLLLLTFIFISQGVIVANVFGSKTGAVLGEASGPVMIKAQAEQIKILQEKLDVFEQDRLIYYEYDANGRLIRKQKQ